jgi:hypothetical protein
MKTPEEYKRRRKIESETAQQVLRKAPPLPPRQLSESEKQKLKSHDIHVLREFRRELRCVVEDLLKNKRFKYFAYPVVIFLFFFAIALPCLLSTVYFFRT